MKAIDNPIINQQLSPNINEDTIDELIDVLQSIYSEILEDFGDEILSLYDDYLRNNGNPHSLPSHNTSGTSREIIEKKFQIIYDSPPKTMILKDIFNHIRKKSSPNLCPMCGSSGIGTVDHYLPQSLYPLYSINLYNLVPACGCNTLRGTTVAGGPNERILHPYFDNALLNRRLLTSKLILNRDESLDIKIEIYENGLTPIEIDMIKFHLNEVVLKTNILNSMADFWGNIKDQPDLIMYNKPTVSIDRLTYYRNVKEHFENFYIAKNIHNSWMSILLHGIIKNKSIIRFLTEKYNTF